MAFDALSAPRGTAATTTFSSLTTTAQESATGSTAVYLINGTPRRGLWAVFHATCPTFTSGGAGNPYVHFKIKHSSDNSTYYDLVSTEADRKQFTATTDTTTQFAGFITSKAYVNAYIVATGASGTFTTLDISWKCYFTPVRPIG